MNKKEFIYILTNKEDSVLSIGVSSDFKQRVYKHKNILAESFTKKYQTHKLVYYEMVKNIESAILRGKQLKR